MSIRQLRVEMEKASSKARCWPNYSLHLDTCSSEILSKKKVEPQETKMFPSDNVLTATMLKLWMPFSCVWHVIYGRLAKCVSMPMEGMAETGNILECSATKSMV